MLTTGLLKLGSVASLIVHLLFLLVLHSLSFANLEGKTPVLVVSAKGVSKFVEVPGLPQEEYPAMVA